MPRKHLYTASALISFHQWIALFGQREHIVVFHTAPVFFLPAGVALVRVDFQIIADLWHQGAGFTNEA